MTTSNLSASELRYRRLFEAAHDGILILDPGSRKIIDVNPFMVKFLGYSYEEFIGRELFEIGVLKDEASNREAFRVLHQTGYIRYDDLPLQTKDGRSVDVEFVSNVYVEGDVQVIQCNVRDISERKKKERALTSAKAQLKRHGEELETVVAQRTAELRVSNMQLETFVYSIAHDLRAPLRTMQGFAQLLVEEQGQAFNRQSRDYAEFINAAAQTMDALLADLLDFSHISQLKIELVPVALEAAIRAALGACQQEVGFGEARIELVPPWPSVLAHPTVLQQVLINLLNNALKFVSDRPAQLRLWNEELPDGVIRVWVEDDGIGIPPEFKERIFQVFQRLHTTQFPGTGIGLAIVQKGMERMGGRVGVESTVGVGSKFWIELAKARPRPIESPQVRTAA